MRMHHRAARALAVAMLTITGLTMPAHAEITSTPWGVTAKGDKVALFTLTGAGGLVARISNFGGVIVNLMVPDKAGHKADIVLGYDDLASYEKGGVFGAVIGRYANRIGQGGTFPLDGRTVQLERASPTQKIVIHGGPHGFQKQVWQAAMHTGSEPSLTLTLVSPDGDAGFPGTVTATVIYTVTRDNALRIEYRASTDKPTVVNLTNHAYFSLGGEGSGDISDQVLQVFADRYTPADADSLPTGAIEPVAGTPLDLRKPVRVGDILGSSFAQIAMRKGLDINMVVRGEPGTMRPAVRVSDPKSGRVMEVSTTQPGVQVYSDNIAGTVTGKGGKQYGNHNSLSFETQHYPDSPNHPNFPTTEIAPGKPLHEVTLFKFSAE